VNADTLKRHIQGGIEIPEDELAEALKTWKAASRAVGLSSSVISMITLNLCHLVFTKNEKFSTFAVMLAGDGQPIMIVNTEFLAKIGHEQAVFAIVHEVYHLLMLHLYDDPALSGNQNWVMSQEITINHRVKNHLKKPLITIDNEVVIVDPEKAYRSYRDAIRKDERTPVTYDDFVKTDIGCFAALEDMPRQMKPPKGSGSCVHAGSGGMGQNNGDSQAPVDPKEAGKLMDRVLEAAVIQAKQGNKRAKDELVGWMESSPEASTLWGDLGAEELRGQTSKERKTSLWERLTANSVATRLMEGIRLRYNTKVWWSPRVTTNGKQPRKHGAIFIDVSGSVPQHVVDRIAALVQEHEDLIIHWHAFDAKVAPFEAGESLIGGGGTSFTCIEEHVKRQNEFGDDGDCCEEDLDFVMVVTDGYAPHIMPEDHEKWIWVILQGTDTWPEAAGMDCIEVDFAQDAIAV
jgi:hypothetical protein